jgi:hypothetical protein
MKTEVKAKPKAASAKAALAAPKAAAAPAVVKGEAAKPEVKAAPKGDLRPNAKGLFWLQMTPGGNALRAYFIALITAQVGDLSGAAGKAFRLWPAVNVGGHLATGRLKREGKAFSLSAAGVNYFTDPLQAADPEALTKWAEAIRTGQAPAGYGKMTPFAE